MEAHCDETNILGKINQNEPNNFLDENSQKIQEKEELLCQ